VIPWGRMIDLPSNLLLRLCYICMRKCHNFNVAQCSHPTQCTYLTVYWPDLVLGYPSSESLPKTTVDVVEGSVRLLLAALVPWQLCLSLLDWPNNLALFMHQSLSDAQRLCLSLAARSNSLVSFLQFWSLCLSLAAWSDCVNHFLTCISM
jgi:hypothetical protein